MKRLALFLPLMLLLSAPAAAQQDETNPTLTASGEGTAVAPPDIATINIGVTTRADKPAEALAANSTDMQAVIDAVTAAGVEDSDITTSGFSISPVYGSQEFEAAVAETPIVVGYEVTNQLMVRIRNIDSSGALLDAVVEAGANQINGISFEIDNPQALQDEAMQAAIADARRRGELMAEAAGVTLVRLVSVSSLATGSPQFDQAVSFRAEVPIIGGEQTVTAQATLVWEIAPR